MRSALQIPSEQNPFADRKRWTADDCRKLEAMELLEAGTYELLDGEIVNKLGQNVPHSLANLRVLLALTLVFGADYVMMPVSIAVSEEDRPEPDAFVTRLPNRDYLMRGNPTPADMRLIVEVSDTTLWRDRNTKARMYGSAGVPEYWVLDVSGRRLFVYRKPVADGYDEVKEYDETQNITPLAAPSHSLLIATILP